MQTQKKCIWGRTIVLSLISKKMEIKIKLYRKLKNVNYKKKQFNETPNYLNTIEKNKIKQKQQQNINKNQKIRTLEKINTKN